MFHYVARMSLLAVLVGAVANVFADDRWETLKAINCIENPTNSSRPGSRGELGPYQFRLSTWRMHTRRPFNLALQRSHADEVAVTHYEWIRATLARAGVPATTFNIACAWNAGVGSVIESRVPASSRRYAQRVVNLVNDYNRAQIAANETRTFAGPRIMIAQ